MSDSESDIELKSILPMKSVKKTPVSPQEHLKKDPKKLTTKEMIHTALQELKTRKGVSLYAIKKYMVERYNTDTEKMNFYIKKYIKHGVESGVIIQTKGIGVSGSFKLAPPKKEEKKTKKATKRKIEKPDKLKPVSEKLDKKKSKDSTKSKAANKGSKIDKKGEEKTKTMKEKPTSTKTKATKKVTMAENTEKVSKRKNNKTKMAENSPPAKKKSKLVKRKSIGSIIKPPKMKPKKRE